MSYADSVFDSMCRNILENGTSTEREKVRPHWEDGTPACTLKIFGAANRYDLRKEFPAVTQRRTAIKSSAEEMLWIWQKKSNNANDLKTRIWDSWADGTGSIGTAYGYQMGKKSEYPEGMFDQTDRVIYDLKNNPYSRRILTNLYCHEDLHGMHLYPCAYGTVWNVTHPENSPAPVLNLMLTQRSQDVLAANNWNTVQYALLLMMMAQVCGMIPGELLHVIADAHIYDRHADTVRGLIARPVHPAPSVTLDPEIKDFYDFTPESIKVENYETEPQIRNIPIAV